MNQHIISIGSILSIIYLCIFLNIKYRMAHLHNLRNTNPRTTFVSSIGEEVKNVAEVVGAAKGLYDGGKGLYTFGRTAAPIVGALLYIYI